MSVLLYTQTTVSSRYGLEKYSTLPHDLLYILCIILFSDFGVLPFFISTFIHINVLVHEHQQMPLKAPTRLSILPLKQHMPNEIRQDIANEMNSTTTTT